MLQKPVMFNGGFSSICEGGMKHDGGMDFCDGCMKDNGGGMGFRWLLSVVGAWSYGQCFYFFF